MRARLLVIGTWAALLGACTSGGGGGADPEDAALDADAPGDAMADPDGMADAMRDAMPDAMRDAMPDGMPDIMPDAIPDAMPDIIPDIHSGPDATPDAMIDAMPDAMPPVDAQPDPDATPDAMLAPDAAPACRAGETQRRPCGLNQRGEEVRTCEAGAFSDWGPCADPDVCLDGAAEERPCGLNGRGAEARVCAAGAWGPYGACGDPDVCLDGAIEQRACGPRGDGSEVRACAEGRWVDWSICDGACADACAPGEARCAGEAVETCVDRDDDPCFEWSPPAPCPAGEVCADGRCALPPLPPVIINEVFYDAVGADAPAVFIELWGPPLTDLDGWTLEAVGGDDGRVYATIPLSLDIGFDGYFLVAPPDAAPGLAAQVRLGGLFDARADLQNGPDGLRLRFGDRIVDAVGYGEVDPAHFAGEGRAAPDVPEGRALSRTGQRDTDDNLADFAGALPSPRAEPPPPCDPGAVEGRACGLGGEQRRTCVDGEWTAYGPCAGGVCAALPDAVVGVNEAQIAGAGLTSPRCDGISGGEALWRFVAPAGGEYTFDATGSAMPVSLSLRRDCHEVDSELACAAFGGPVAFDLAAGEAVTALVDARDRNRPGAVRLDVAFDDPAACVDDAGEHDDAMALARDAGDRARRGLVDDPVLCGRDADWYRVEVPPSCFELSARARADRPVAVTIVDRFGREVARDARNLEVRVPSPAPGVYFVRVDQDRVGRTPYTVELDPCGAPSCPGDDRLEDNDRAFEATVARPGARREGIVCAGDDDYFTAPLAGGCFGTLTLEWTAAEFETVEALFGRDVALPLPPAPETRGPWPLRRQRRMRVRADLGDMNLTLALRADAAGVAEPAGVPYRVRFAEHCFDFDCAGDANEPNDAPDAATPLDYTDTAAGGACRGESDYFAIPALTGCRVAYRAAARAAGLQARLLDAEGAELAADPDAMEVVAPADGPIYLRLDTDRDRSDYLFDVDVTCDDAAHVCGPDDLDPYERNELSAMATPLAIGRRVDDAFACRGDNDVYDLGPSRADCLFSAEVEAQGEADLSLAAFGRAPFEPSRYRALADSAPLGRERLVFDTRAGERWMVTVAGQDAPGAPYALSTTLLCPDTWSCPADDPDAANVDPAAASPLAAIDQRVGVLCTEGGDHFRVALEPGCGLYARVDGEAPVTVDVLDAAAPDGPPLAAEFDRIAFRDDAGGERLLRLRAPAGTGYRLSAVVHCGDLRCPPPGGPDPGVVYDDPYEPNDRAAEAAELPADARIDGVVCPGAGAEDHFVVEVGLGCAIDVAVARPDLEGPPEIDLLRFRRSHSAARGGVAVNRVFEHVVADPLDTRVPIALSPSPGPYTLLVRTTCP